MSPRENHPQEEGDTQWEEGFSRALSSSALSTILEKKRH